MVASEKAVGFFEIDLRGVFEQNGGMKKLGVGLLGILLVSLPAQSAQADAPWGSGLRGSADNLLLVTTAALLVDTTFTIHDAWVFHKDERSGTAWSIAEIALTAPQAIFLQSGLIWGHAAGKKDDVFAVDVLTIVPGIWTTQLTTHGIWSLASDKVRLGDRYGLSWGLAANLTFTAGAISSVFGKRLGGITFGVFEMIGTAPSVAVGLYRSTLPLERDRNAWIGYAAWSSALFLHGVVSTAVGFPNKKEEPTVDPAHREQGFVVVPTVVSDGLRQAPGLVVSGRF